jgi:hypothetical protein
MGVNPDMLSVLALAVSTLIVGTGSLAVWVWHRGWHGGKPPRE